MTQPPFLDDLIMTRFNETFFSGTQKSENNSIQIDIKAHHHSHSKEDIIHNKFVSCFFYSLLTNKAFISWFFYSLLTNKTCVSWFFYSLLTNKTLHLQRMLSAMWHQFSHLLPMSTLYHLSHLYVIHSDVFYPHQPYIVYNTDVGTVKCSPLYYNYTASLLAREICLELLIAH